MLYSRRKRLKELAEREAAGESFWTSRFEEHVRVRILHAASALDSSYAYGDPTFEDICRAARQLIMSDEGLLTLQGGTPGRPDFLAHLQRCSHEEFPTAIEALGAAMTQTHTFNQRHFAVAVNEILAEHRVSFEYVDMQMVEFESKELHVEVVAPTLRLLAGRDGWDDVEKAYRNALDELSSGSPEDAITDAGTALQEALNVLGCDGKSLGPLITSARDKGLLAPHDSPMAGAIEKLMHWVSADRSTMGDTHNAAPATREDAWLALHVVGALILRLASGGSRG